MKKAPVNHAPAAQACVVLAMAAAVAGGCGLSGEGVAPPGDRVFYPSGLLADPGSRWLYVVSSNADLRYSSGTLTAVDLRAAAGHRAEPGWAPCPGLGAAAPPGGDACCRDVLDRDVLNCDERAYISGRGTIRIGSFGGEIVQQTYDRGGELWRRLFIAVRGEPSVSFVDALPAADGSGVLLHCQGRPGDPPGTDVPDQALARCADDWRVRAAQADPARLLPAEPYALALDDKLGVLYVGHLRGGQVTVLDVCLPLGRAPDLVTIHEELFAPVNDNAGVTSLTVADPGSVDGRIYAGSRFSPIAGAFVVRGAGARECDPAAGTFLGRRDIALVGAGGIISTAFSPLGADVRGFLFSADRRRAYLLHRRPGAVVVLDVRIDPGTGGQLFSPGAVVEVCAGPTRMMLHDAGRGPQLFVTCFEGGQVYVVDPERPAVVATIDIGRGPAALAFAPDAPDVGYVAGFSDNNLSVIDLKPGSRTEHRVVQRIGFPSAVPR